MKTDTNNDIPPSPDSWVKSFQHEEKFDYEFPKVTIVVPTYNCSQNITLTLDSLLRQDYPDFEIVIIDAESTDRTLEIIKSYHDNRIHVYSMTEHRRYEMLNKAIIQAQGTYINFIFPGDFYLRQDTIKWMMTLALTHQLPDLVYCGTILRDGKSEVKTLYRPFTLSMLKKGQQPTSLQSCWFKVLTLKELGKFDVSYTLRGGYDLLCRFSLHGKLRAQSTTRILTDYDLRWVTKRMVVRHFWETFKTLYEHFGIGPTLKWLLIQKDLSRLAKLWLRSTKLALTGQ
jgi:glycosyltransferase involved in cell wall biosynthesis